MIFLVVFAYLNTSAGVPSCGCDAVELVVG